MRPFRYVDIVGAIVLILMGNVLMPRYIILMNLTEQGAKNIREGPTHTGSCQGAGSRRWKDD